MESELDHCGSNGHPRASSYRQEDGAQSHHSGLGRGGFKAFPLSNTSRGIVPKAANACCHQLLTQLTTAQAGAPQRPSVLQQQHMAMKTSSPSRKSSWPSLWPGQCSLWLPGLKTFMANKAVHSSQCGQLFKPAPKVPEPSWLFLPRCLLRVERAAASTWPPGPTQFSAEQKANTLKIRAGSQLLWSRCGIAGMPWGPCRRRAGERWAGGSCQGAARELLALHKASTCT